MPNILRLHVTSQLINIFAKTGSQPSWWCVATWHVERYLASRYCCYDSLGKNAIIMPYLCAVKGCSNNSSRDKQFRFYRFPKVIDNQGQETRKLSEERRRKWLENLDRKNMDEINLNNTRICSKHFISGEVSGVLKYIRNGIAMVSII